MHMYTYVSYMYVIYMYMYVGKLHVGLISAKGTLASFPGRAGEGKNGLVSIVCACAGISIYYSDTTQ